MKKLLKNKRMISGLIAMTLGVAILVMSLSLAWFTSDGVGPGGSIELGTLIVKADVKIQDQGKDQNYPGSDIYFESVGTVQNFGSLNALCQLEIITTATTADGTWAPAQDEIYIRWLEDGVPAYDRTKPGNVPYYVFDPADPEPKTYPLGVWLSDTGDSYNWMKGADGKYYVEMFGNDELHYAFDLVLVGNKMGNAYQGAKIDVKAKWNAVQANPPQASVDYFSTAAFPIYIGMYNFGYGAVETPLYDKAGVPTPFFEVFDLYIYGGPGVDPDGSGNIVPFGAAYDQYLIAYEQYVKSLPDSYWVKHALAAKNNFDF